ncbi:ChaB family protein [Blastococcus sp. SYSU D00695]
MPKTTKSGKARDSEIPSTLRRSDDKAKRTFAKAHDAAMDSYADEERANRTAWAAVKHTHEKVGDHWQPKAGGRKGPSDAQAAGGRGTRRETKGGVNTNATKEHLLGLAKELGIRGRSDMKKKQLVDAIQKANDKETAKAGTKKASGGKKASGKKKGSGKKKASER